MLDSMEKRILVVEDQRDIADLIAMHLRDLGHRVDCEHDGPAGFEAARTGRHDLIVLDIMLPGRDGLDIVRALRMERVTTPVLILTARSTEIDRVLGLELGADDYLPKPCSPRELLARVRAVLRRRDGAPEERKPSRGYEFGGYRLDVLRRQLQAPNGVAVLLTAGEFALLRAFLERPGRVLTREQLLEYARGGDAEVFDRAIDVQISRLRRKLDDGQGGQDLIRTIRNEGYMFTPKVKRT